MRKVDYFLIIVFVLLNALIAGGTYYRNIYQYSLAFLNINIVAIMIIFALCEIAFYMSYKKLIKKAPSMIIMSLFTLFLAIITYNVISINSLFVSLISKATFNNGTNIFIFLNLILCGIMISNYDFPQSINISEFYKNSRSHLYSNFGVFMVVALVVAIIGYLNTTFVYAISVMFLINSIYFVKAILANIRR